MPGHVFCDKARSVACRREPDALDLALEPSTLLFMGFFGRGKCTCSARHAACRSRLTVRRRKRQGAEEEVREETEEEEIKHGKSQRSGSQDTPLISTKTSRDRELRGMPQRHLY